MTNKQLELAIIFATKHHAGQTRKSDGRPYIMHPLSVMNTLYKVKKSKNINLLAIATVLHDVVEDCNVSLDDIAKEFGYKVTSIVEELTSDKEEIKNIGKTDYLIQKMVNMSSYALVIKLCDRLDNTNDLSTMNENFKLNYCKETLDIIKGINGNRKLTDTHLRIIDMIIKNITF